MTALRWSPNCDLGLSSFERQAALMRPEFFFELQGVRIAVPCHLVKKMLPESTHITIFCLGSRKIRDIRRSEAIEKGPALIKGA